MDSKLGFQWSTFDAGNHWAKTTAGLTGFISPTYYLNLWDELELDGRPWGIGLKTEITRGKNTLAWRYDQSNTFRLDGIDYNDAKAWTMSAGITVTGGAANRTFMSLSVYQSIQVSVFDVINDSLKKAGNDIAGLFGGGSNANGGNTKPAGSISAERVTLDESHIFRSEGFSLDIFPKLQWGLFIHAGTYSLEQTNAGTTAGMNIKLGFVRIFTREKINGLVKLGATTSQTSDASIGHVTDGTVNTRDFVYHWLPWLDASVNVDF